MGREKNETVKLRECCGREKTEKSMRENGDGARERERKSMGKERGEGDKLDRSE